MSDPLGTALAVGEGVAKLIGLIIDLWRRAQQGDTKAIDKLKRVDEILSDESPTERAFKRYDDLLASKPPRGGA